MGTLHAFYGTTISEGECPHSQLRLTFDLSTDRWYVECPGCQATGPAATTEAEALAVWREIVQCLELWNLASMGSSIARRDLAIQLGRPHDCCGCGGVCDSGPPCPMAAHCGCRETAPLSSLTMGGVSSVTVGGVTIETVDGRGLFDLGAWTEVRLS